MPLGTGPAGLSAMGAGLEVAGPGGPFSMRGPGLLGSVALEATCGVAGIVLGILALAGVDRQTLLGITGEMPILTVAMLSFGVGIALLGATLFTRVFRVFSHGL